MPTRQRSIFGLEKNSRSMEKLSKLRNEVEEGSW
jgi:hypothetical protein